ncbi:MAG: hypothetical protein A2X94_11085 [Bdellovibrionales bacterium GWB1_55_8]|nr:MAG: hypothetical protein A2X94_11085 [Bdellovibrionales bacterium GWB1_55_8]
MSMGIVLSDGQQILLPADQVVFHEDSNGSARVGLGGMSFEGIQEKQLVFWRVRDLLPDEHLSPQRELRVTLVPETVKSIHVRGNRVWPSREPANPLH